MQCQQQMVCPKRTDSKLCAVCCVQHIDAREQLFMNKIDLVSRLCFLDKAY